jgi:hypothetical protein
VCLSVCECVCVCVCECVCVCVCVCECVCVCVCECVCVSVSGWMGVGARGRECDCGRVGFLIHDATRRRQIASSVALLHFSTL